MGKGQSSYRRKGKRTTRHTCTPAYIRARTCAYTHEYLHLSMYRTLLRNVQYRRCHEVQRKKRQVLPFRYRLHVCIPSYSSSCSSYVFVSRYVRPGTKRPPVRAPARQAPRLRVILRRSTVKLSARRRVYGSQNESPFCAAAKRKRMAPPRAEPFDFWTRAVPSHFARPGSAGYLRRVLNARWGGRRWGPLETFPVCTGNSKLRAVNACTQFEAALNVARLSFAFVSFDVLARACVFSTRVQKRAAWLDPFREIFRRSSQDA